jgi:hypothetical protein
MTEDQTAAIQSFETSSISTTSEGIEGTAPQKNNVSRVTKVKTHGKIPALTKLGEHLGIFKDAGKEPNVIYFDIVTGD